VSAKRTSQGDRSREIPFCGACKEYGHLVRDCRRGANLGDQNQKSVGDLSEYIASLCATQVDGLAFLCIPDCPSEVHARERATTVVVTMLKGMVTRR
jgi:hypothetical protein